MLGMRAFVFSLSLFAVVSAVVVAQGRSVGDGVYSDAQARRGGRVYRETCAACHGEELGGGEMGPGLTGAAFLLAWEGAPLSDLLLVTRETMPQDNPGGLSEEQSLDVVAYILRYNEFPPGDEDLGGGLDQIRIENRQ